jgi:hypothetical protein
MPKKILVIYRNQEFYGEKSEIYRKEYNSRTLKRDIELMMEIYGGERAEYTHKILKLEDEYV